MVTIPQLHSGKEGTQKGVMLRGHQTNDYTKTHKRKRNFTAKTGRKFWCDWGLTRPNQQQDSS
jgi:hypothetical protein